MCTCDKFQDILSRLIMTNLSRTLKSGPWKNSKMKTGHGYKKVGNPVLNVTGNRYKVGVVFQ